MQTTTVVAQTKVSGKLAQATQITQRDVLFATTNLGPLTTSFIPPKSCQSLTLGYSGPMEDESDALTFNYGQTCDAQDNTRLNPTCYPPRYAVAYDNFQAADGTKDIIYPVLSPASVCPAGYISACGFGVPTPKQARDVQRGVTVGHQLFVRETTMVLSDLITQLIQPTQTAIGCCPRYDCGGDACRVNEGWHADTIPSSGYNCVKNKVWHCASLISSDSVVTADDNSSCGKSHTTRIKKYTSAPETYMYADAPCIVLVDDLSQSISTNTTASSSLFTTVTTTISTASNTTGAYSAGDASRGLSTGTKAAIGVSIPLVAILVASGLFVFFRWRSRRASQTPGDGDAEHKEPDTAHKAETDGSEPRQSTILGSPAPRGVSMLSDDSTIYGQGAGKKMASELYGSLATPRLHEDIMELPAETGTHIYR